MGENCCFKRGFRLYLTKECKSWHMVWEYYFHVRLGIILTMKPSKAFEKINVVQKMKPFKDYLWLPSQGIQWKQSIIYMVTHILNLWKLSEICVFNVFKLLNSHDPFNILGPWLCLMKVDRGVMPMLFNSWLTRTCANHDLHKSWSKPCLGKLE